MKYAKQFIINLNKAPGTYEQICSSVKAFMFSVKVYMVQHTGSLQKNALLSKFFMLPLNSHQQWFGDFSAVQSFVFMPLLDASLLCQTTPRFSLLARQFPNNSGFICHFLVSDNFEYFFTADLSVVMTFTLWFFLFKWWKLLFPTLWWKFHCFRSPSSLEDRTCLESLLTTFLNIKINCSPKLISNHPVSSQCSQI